MLEGTELVSGRGDLNIGSILGDAREVFHRLGHPYNLIPCKMRVCLLGGPCCGLYRWLCVYLVSASALFLL